MTPRRIAWRTLDDLVARCRAGAGCARALAPDVIVGVPRSGMLPASILALALDRPLSDTRSFIERRNWRQGDKNVQDCIARRILLVEDSVNSGKALARNVALIRAARPEIEILTCAVYSSGRVALDLAFDHCPTPRLFEWNWWRHKILRACAVDIDGVLCRDPTKAERRDLALYARFVETVPPLWLPRHPVGMLVTGRAEHWRRVTESWLARHGVRHGALHMLAGASPKTDEGHAAHKAGLYRASRALLFIESNEAQARMIAKLSGKDALCIATRTLFTA
jgi:uncharacterized HAD superfamily protein